TAALDPAVVAASDDAAFVHDHRADRYAAFLKSLACFVESRLHECIHRGLRGLGQAKALSGGVFFTARPRLPQSGTNRGQPCSNLQISRMVSRNLLIFKITNHVGIS